ncbi:MAG: hypothetical protein HRT45_10830 [Bdellovibrionales bacterium]|nr:hypothetical protein [Bdellovibrionales bacterium]
MDKVLMLAAMAAVGFVVFQLHFRKKEKMQQARINERLSSQARRVNQRPELAKLNLIDLDLDIDLD